MLMSYKCSVCGSNDVDIQGGVCELCAIGQDPYARADSQRSASSSHRRNVVLDTSQEVPSTRNSKKRNVLLSGGAQLSNQDPYGNDIGSDDALQSKVQVYQPGQVPSMHGTGAVSGGQATNVSAMPSYLADGVVKNVSCDTEENSTFSKIMKAVFSGVPYSSDDTVTIFQVFPDFSGTTTNALGNVCDQVIVYGKITNGTICENNDVEVYGYRDTNNNIIATKIRNKATGTMVTPSKSTSAGFIRGIFIAVLILLLLLLATGGAAIVAVVVVIILLFSNLPVAFKLIGGIFAWSTGLFKGIFK